MYYCIWKVNIDLRIEQGRDEEKTMKNTEFYFFIFLIKKKAKVFYSDGCISLYALHESNISALENYINLMSK